MFKTNYKLSLTAIGPKGIGIIGVGMAFFLASLALGSDAFCAPAIPVVHELQQSDGSKFNARLWGDERSHGWETVSGYTVIQDEKTLAWHYARKDPVTKSLVRGNPVVALEDDRALVRHIRPADQAVQRSYDLQPQRTNSRALSSPAVSGTRHLPVMMVNFSDTSAAFTSADFEQVLFASGTQSMKDYYEEVSYGAFTITPGPSGITGWYNAAQTHDYYGRNDGAGYDLSAAELVIETVAAADAAVDFSAYDSDGDCYADVVVIIHQGSGEEAGGSSSDIWSHRWNLRSAAYYGDGSGVFVTNDTAACGPIKINDYVIQPETLFGDIQTVGVFAHEYGHILGLPDLYDVDGSSSGIGNWGLMGAGSWNGVARWGDSPAHFSAWSKYQLGWIDPVVVTSPLMGEMIEPASQVDDTYLLYPAGQTGSLEYFLVENRQHIGFDAGLPGTGLAIWHIDDSVSMVGNTANTEECLPNQACSDSHYRVSLVQADGYWDLEYGFNRGDLGDLFPGRFQNISFTSSSDPDNLLFDGSASLVSIAHIIQSGTVITADLAFASSDAALASSDSGGSGGGGGCFISTLVPVEGLFGF